MRPAPQDSKVDKWVRWITEPIRADVLNIHHRQAVYRRVAEIISTRQPPLPESLFFGFLRETYATSQLAAVRRQAEASTRVISLRRLLGECEAEPERLSRQRFVGAWPPEDQRRGNATFSTEFAGAVGEHLDAAIVRADIDRLEAGVQRVVAHVDQYVAHWDERPVADLATFAELNAAIEAIGDLFKQYNLLLTGSSYHTLVPVPQQPWETIFREPWIVDGGNGNE